MAKSAQSKHQAGFPKYYLTHTSTHWSVINNLMHTCRRFFTPASKHGFKSRARKFAVSDHHLPSLGGCIESCACRSSIVLVWLFSISCQCWSVSRPNDKKIRSGTSESNSLQWPACTLWIHRASSLGRLPNTKTRSERQIMHTITNDTANAQLKMIHTACIGLARTLYLHRTWLWFSCQKYRIYTIYIWFWPTFFLSYSGQP